MKKKMYLLITFKERVVVLLEVDNIGQLRLQRSSVVVLAKRELLIAVIQPLERLSGIFQRRIRNSRLNIYPRDKVVCDKNSLIGC